jgi:hypothetical protein
MFEGQLPLPKITITVKGATQKDLFNQLATITEVFGERSCGLCEGEDIIFAKRNVDGNDFFEMVCRNPQCGARLSFGQSKQHPGEMFPIRKLVTSGPDRGKPSRKKGEYDGKGRGWTKYRGQPIDKDD